MAILIREVVFQLKKTQKPKNQNNNNKMNKTAVHLEACEFPKYKAVFMITWTE